MLVPMRPAGNGPHYAGRASAAAGEHRLGLAATARTPSSWWAMPCGPWPIGGGWRAPSDWRPNRSCARAGPARYGVAWAVLNWEALTFGEAARSAALRLMRLTVAARASAMMIFRCFVFIFISFQTWRTLPATVLSASSYPGRGEITQSPRTFPMGERSPRAETRERSGIPTDHNPSFASNAGP